MTLTLIIGGARSGKSAYAEQLAATAGCAVRYVATADEAEMPGRVAAHRARRPAAWEVVEANGTLAEHLDGDACVLVDGVGVWLAGRMRDRDAEPLAEVRRLADAAARRSAPTIVVTEEAGMGVLPAGELSRRWLDLAGDAAQLLAARADAVTLVVAGRPLPLRAAAPEPELRLHGDTMVAPGTADHAVNVVHGGPPDWLLEALAGADLTRYPDDARARVALAARHGRTPEEVVPLPGAVQAFWLLAAALRPALACCVHPSFTEPEAALRAHGVPVLRALRDPDENFALDPGAVPDEADLVVVGNPNNPTGTLDPAAAILALRRPGRTLVVDEAFMDLVPGEPGSLAGEPSEDVIVVRSLTKAFSIPGLRAGYALAPPALAARLRSLSPPWATSAPALAALEACAMRTAGAERVEAEREDLQARLAAVPGMRTWPAAANFVLVEVADGPAALARLQRAGIAVRPAGSFPGLGEHHLRITARDPDANAALAGALCG